jgi:hypothetical protein
MNRSDEKTWLRDGSTVGFAGGMDGSRRASDIDRDQNTFLLNLTCRNGVLMPRPGWKNQPLTFAPGVQAAFQFANFQTAQFYDGNGYPSLLSSQGGRQFRIDLTTTPFSVSEITPTAPLSTVTTTATFTIPAVSDSSNLYTVAVSVLDSSKMSTQYPNINIGGFPLILFSVATPTSIVVKNNVAANVGQVVGIGSAVAFTGVSKNSPSQLLNWSITAENYWILQDNQSYAVIYDGSQSVRADPSLNQLPVGNVMCYAMGRISVALPDRRSYAVGDLVFGSSGTAVKGYRDAILFFTENMYLNEGGNFVARVFGAPSNSGDILAMKAGAMTDTALGQGPMIVGTPYGVFSVSLPFDRTVWKNLANALQTYNPIIGPTGQESTVLVNTDLWYRSLDGTRTYLTAIREFNGSPGNTPVSSEVDEFIEADANQWLEYGSAVVFDNRVLMTISPQMTPNGVYHRGLVVMDLNPTSTLRKKSPPAWEGIWTGLRILKLVTGIVNNTPRCFLYVLNDNSQIELWELSTADKFDNGVNRINWEFQTPSYNCGDTDRFKKLKTARLLVDGLVGTLDLTISYRPDSQACWFPWYTVPTLCAKSADCGPAAPCPPSNPPTTFQDQQRYPIRLPEPPDDFDGISNRKAATGFEHQLRVVGSGSAQIVQLRIYCLDESEQLGLERTDIS